MSAVEGQAGRSGPASVLDPGNSSTAAGGGRETPGRGSGRGAETAAIALILITALALRLIGHKTGLPFIYNADENAHFVPRAIGMFGHSYNPGYFINPPALTYLLHALFALRWGGRDGVSEAFAVDPGSVFGLARITVAVLGTIAVGLLYLAGRRLFDRRTGLLAAALLAVAFLPVFYSHFALNDVPALAPVCLALFGIAEIHRRGSLIGYAVAGAGLGLGCATKYTAGIVLVALIAAAVASERPGGGRRLGGLAIALVIGLAGFLIANPYALLDYGTFADGLSKQSTASSDGGGKLGLTEDNGLRYYLETLTWGLGIVPALAALGGAVGLVVRDRRMALLLVPPPVLFILFMGGQDRFFARWLLPAYPFLCLLAAWGALGAAAFLTARLGRRRPRAGALAGGIAAIALCAQGVVFSVHNDIVLSREDTRQQARDWMVANVPAGTKVVIEPIVPDQWAQDPGRPSPETRNGNRWIKWANLRTKLNPDGTRRRGTGRTVKLEDYERITRPGLVRAYARGGFCWVMTGSTQSGRAEAEPRAVPDAIRYYEELRRRGEVVFRATPFRRGSGSVPFSFDRSFNYYPLSYVRPGPEVVIYRLRGGRCGD